VRPASQSLSGNRARQIAGLYRICRDPRGHAYVRATRITFPGVTKLAVPQRLGTLPVVGLMSGACSLALAGYFWVAFLRAPPSDFGHGFEIGVALLFATFATGALVASVLALTLGPRWPGFSSIASFVGVVCGLAPPGLVIAFVLVETFG
jgi:hypothetical protein